ncbi:MAG: hypothetical protein ABIS06_10335 [Vicinamibacterales bacterium]
MNVFNAAALALAAHVLTFQGPAPRPARPLPSTALMRIETGVEGEFRQWERSSAVRLRDVTVTPQTGGALMTVLLTLPRRQQFEPNAEIAFERIWNALGRQPNAYRELGRIAVSLKRDAREMTVTCSARRVEASKGRSEFANLKRTCHVN